MAFSSYSFEDVTIAFNHANVGSTTSTGAGVGSITVAMANDRTAHEVAADGTVMVTKVIAKNGTIAVQFQQVSSLQAFMLKWYNYIDSSSTLSDWTGMTVTISSTNLGDKIVCTGVSPQKFADRPYQAQGSQVTWTLMAAEISHES